MRDSSILTADSFFFFFVVVWLNSANILTLPVALQLSLEIGLVN